MANLAYIQITRNCNQRCIICSNPPSGWKDLSLVQAKKLIDRYIREKYDGLILSGGEPTIYPYLPELINYCEKKKFPVRIISNGQRMADAGYVRLLVAAGLKHVEISLYSSRKDIQARLTGNVDSLDNVKAALNNLIKTKIRIDICITINKLNADHLSETVRFILKGYPAIPHLIFNNLDLRNDRVKANPQTISHLADFEAELIAALKMLAKNKKTFRVEHVPLCYLPEFEHCSTETRKIVKQEVRPIYFLDGRGFDFQKGFRHEKDRRCKVCFLNEICAGLFRTEWHLNKSGLYPVFVSKEEIEKRVFAS